MKLILFVLTFMLLACSSNSQVTDSKMKGEDKIVKSEQEWKATLSPEQYQICRLKATEMPGSGKYDKFWQKGQYLCAACGNHLFDSETKFNSGSGWPSFYDVHSKNNLTLVRDSSHGMQRIEVSCSKCGSHLGHVFDDGPKPTGLRYCINSLAMEFVPYNENDQ